MSQKVGCKVGYEKVDGKCIARKVRGESYIIVERRFVGSAQKMIDNFNVDMKDLRSILNDQVDEEY